MRDLALVLVLLVALGFAPVPAAASVPESHMIGCGAENTTPPAALSVASRPPAFVSDKARPSAFTPNVNRSRAGFFAASAVLTTSSSWNPSVSARSCRSTSGSTPLYVAVSPLSVGAGNDEAQEYDSFRPARSKVANGFEPPPENDIPTAATAGATLPSGCLTKVLSIAFHAPPTRARTGRRC
ncbi:hypothetical protein ABZ527_31640 [Streptomyces griseofuscus]|uniref:hypothetical protein n=1 Tax=Streptomyces griseofuscus TaxID=146922 RepID=UPI0033C9A8E0